MGLLLGACFQTGAAIVIRNLQMLYPNLPESGKNVGMIMTENYRAALRQDVYTTDPTGVMKSAEGWHDSMYGRIASAWKVDGKTLRYRAAYTLKPGTYEFTSTL